MDIPNIEQVQQDCASLVWMCVPVSIAMTTEVSRAATSAAWGCPCLLLSLREVQSALESFPVLEVPFTKSVVMEAGPRTGGA